MKARFLAFARAADQKFCNSVANAEPNSCRDGALRPRIDDQAGSGDPARPGKDDAPATEPPARQNQNSVGQTQVAKRAFDRPPGRRRHQRPAGIERACFRPATPWAPADNRDVARQCCLQGALVRAGLPAGYEDQGARACPDYSTISPPVRAKAAVHAARVCMASLAIVTALRLSRHRDTSRAYRDRTGGIAGGSGSPLLWECQPAKDGLGNWSRCRCADTPPQAIVCKSLQSIKNLMRLITMGGCRATTAANQLWRSLRTWASSQVRSSGRLADCLRALPR